MSVSPSKACTSPLRVDGGFERPQRGGADGDDAAAGGARPVDPVGGRLRQDGTLRMQPVLADRLAAHRQERAGTDVQGEH